jgi:dephospho-CoA kinase
MYEEVILGITENSGKSNGLFTYEERKQMAERCLAHIHNAGVVVYSGMTVDYMYQHGILVQVRGLRDGKDLEEERALQQHNDNQGLPLLTSYFITPADEIFVSSSAAKAIERYNGNLDRYVPLHVKQCLETKMNNQYIVGITGEPGVGKSYVSNRLVELAQARGIPACNLELDHLAHRIHQNSDLPLYEATRARIEATFGAGVRNPDGTINRKELGEIVFNDQLELKKLNGIMGDPLLSLLRSELYRKEGLILFDAALIAEGGWNTWCNNNVLLVSANKDTQQKRLLRRPGMDADKIARRLSSQYDTEVKRRLLGEQIAKHHQGQVFEYDNSEGVAPEGIERLLDEVITSVDLYGRLKK